jgi:RNA 2',3'-cyclic 3'-phosphodiesterase
LSGLPDRIRAFIAIRTNAEVEDALTEFIGTLRDSGGGVRWTRRANLHVTLRFLGDDAAAEQLERLDRTLAQIAAATRPLVIEVRGTGVFPNASRPRVVWIGLHSDPLIELARQIESAAVTAGFPAEPHGFSPHLTIGRIRDPRGWRPVRGRIAAAADRVFGATPVDSMSLYRSTLGGEAATYTELARYQLRG